MGAAEGYEVWSAAMGSEDLGVQAAMVLRDLVGLVLGLVLAVVGEGDDAPLLGERSVRSR